jgi:hypothetical protein
VQSTGFFVHGKLAWNVLLCSVTVLSANYQYQNGSFSVQNSTKADLNMTRRISTMAATGLLGDHVSNVVEGAGLVSGDYVSSYALELSREFVALSASMYEPADVYDAVKLTPGIGAKLQMAPLALLMATVLVYWYVVAESGTEEPKGLTFAQPLHRADDAARRGRQLRYAPRGPGPSAAHRPSDRHP